MYFATSYAPSLFVRLKEAGAALDDVQARLANSYKENQTISVFLTKKEPELTRAKDKSRPQTLKHDGLRRKSRRGRMRMPKGS